MQVKNMNNVVTLDYQSREPIFKQIVSQIERYVALGILNSGDKLPSTREMAADLGVNPNTVRKAYTELENNGVIVTISTKGTFIADNTKNVKTEKITEGIEEIKSKIEELMKLGISKEEIINKLK